MIAQSLFFPESASTAAQRVDALLWFLTAVCGAVGLLVAFLVVYFAIRYRRRSPDDCPPTIEGSLRLELFWTAVPLVVGLIMFVWGLEVYFYLVEPPENAKEIYVVGKQWMWKIQHPEGQREINELHVPVNQPIKLVLTSEDVIHDFFVPAFRTKVDVLPNRYVYTWFQATKTGRYRLFCAEYCGLNHSGMVGEVVVMRPDEYQQWLSSRAEGSLAMEGRKLFLKYECASCHSATALARAPVLEGLYNQPVRLSTGRTVTADDSYLRESIVEPAAKVVAGYEPIMPTFKGVISEEEIVQLLAFLRTVGPGETPPRVDDAPPPVAAEHERRPTPQGQSQP